MRLAAKSALAGTPAYMAPEVVQANLNHAAHSRVSAFNGKKVSWPSSSPMKDVTILSCIGMATDAKQ